MTRSARMYERFDDADLTEDYRLLLRRGSVMRQARRGRWSLTHDEREKLRRRLTWQRED